MKVNFIEPSFEIPELATREAGERLLWRIEQYGRISHRSEERQTLDSYIKFLQANVIQHGDWSITEHEKITVIVTTDRGISHEVVRHRIGSYTQESTRFVRYGGKMVDSLSFIVPLDTKFPDAHRATCDRAAREYEMMIQTGEKPEIARSILPHALATKIAITYNLRNWRHFFMMRTTKETHPELRRWSIPLLARFKELIPILYDDIMPLARQADSQVR